MLDFFDFISNSVMMPVVALLTCIFIGWIVGTKSLEEEVMLSAEFKLRKVWAFMIKFIAPIVLVIIWWHTLRKQWACLPCRLACPAGWPDRLTR